jgi:xanthine dehydrogenase iron-sulfur cluster and FAD-binding subunit A
MRPIVNSDLVETDLPAVDATLDFLRTALGLKGTKEGCPSSTASPAAPSSRACWRSTTP